MAHLIDKDALVAEIERRVNSYLRLQNTPEMSDLQEELQNKIDCLNSFKGWLNNTLEVKESQLSNPRFPHLNNIVDKVFGTGNLESWEYEEAVQLVLLAKEELLKDLEVKEVDLEKEMVEWHKEHFKKNGTFIGKSGFYLTNNSQMDIAKHFFELGLKARQS